MYEVYKKIDFGSYEARSDKNFGEVYVEPPDFETLLDKQFRIIVGRKGSGKSALVKGIKLNHLSEYDGMVELDAGDPDFKKLVDIYKSLEIHGTFEFRPLVRNMWFSSISVMLMNKVLDNQDTLRPAFSYQLDAVSKYLEKNGWLKKSFRGLTESVLSTASKLISTVREKLGTEKQDSVIIEIIKRYPTGQNDFCEAFKSLGTLIKATKGYIITFDNIDRYFDKSAGVPLTQDDVRILRVFFEGLIYGIFDLSSERVFEKILAKIMIPADKYSPLKLRDSDKIEQIVQTIVWTKQGLKSFICKRIAYSLDVDISGLDSQAIMEKTWYRVFPRTISNARIVEGKEDSFDYILRHTLYRPRDLQIHCSRIITVAKKMSAPISEKIVQSSVATTNEEVLCKYVIREFEGEYPYVEDIFNAFKGKNNVLFYEDVYRTVRRGLELFARRTGELESKDTASTLAIEQAITFLYNIGFLGYFVNPQLPELRDVDVKRFHGKEYAFFFAYNRSYPNFRNSETLVIHPMFYEAYEIVPDEKLVIG
jgi:AAA15 family ATPase/GTPase